MSGELIEFVYKEGARKNCPRCGSKKVRTDLASRVVIVEDVRQTMLMLKQTCCNPKCDIKPTWYRVP